MKVQDKQLTISFCTLCMNRLHHIKETLQRNIEDNTDYEKATFVLLDYNSSDGLVDWVKKNMTSYLLSGKLAYYKYEHASYFHRSHSRNLAFKVAQGEIICNVDADNYTGTGFAHYINEQFLRDMNIFLTTIDFLKKNDNYSVSSDVKGRLCLRKDDFFQLRGYDERMANYGYEDYDLANRLELLGRKRVLIQGDEFLKFIPHDSEERYSSNDFTENIDLCYINYKKPWESSILILFRDQTFSLTSMIDNWTIDADDVRYAYRQRKPLFDLDFKDNGWQGGKWTWSDNVNINLYLGAGRMSLKAVNNRELHGQDGERFFAISDKNVLDRLYMIYVLSKNRAIMEQNIKDGQIIVNKEHFGSGALAKNFGSQFQ